MDLNRLSMDLTAALEASRRVASRGGAAYIRPRHLLSVMLDRNGALARLAPPLGLDAEMARRLVDGVTDAENAYTEAEVQFREAQADATSAALQAKKADQSVQKFERARQRADPRRLRRG